jgi:hypothetical protein
VAHPALPDNPTLILITSTMHHVSRVVKRFSHHYRIRPVPAHPIKAPPDAGSGRVVRMVTGCVRRGRYLFSDFS